MEIPNIKDMFKGWFVGNFVPTIYKTNDVEVALKEHKAGDYEDFHHHKIATEITVVVEGIMEMNGIEYKKNDIIVLAPNKGSDFKAITDTRVLVVKIPGANDDKYLGNA